MGMDTVELIWKIEERFAIRIPNNDASQIHTVQNVYDVVMKHLSINGRIIENMENTINAIIADQAGLELHEIQPHKSITNDFGLD